MYGNSMETKCPRGQLERIAGRLLDHAQLHDDVCPHDDEQVQWAHDMRAAVALLRSQADEIERLQAALAYARNGFELAYNAAERGFNDEVLLHCGHHGAAADRAIQPPNAAFSGRDTKDSL